MVDFGCHIIGDKYTSIDPNFDLSQKFLVPNFFLSQTVLFLRKYILSGRLVLMCVITGEVII